MRYLVITFFFSCMFISFSGIHAQSELTPKTSQYQLKNNAFYFELLGNSGNTLSLNYERHFSKSNKWVYRVGFGYRKWWKWHYYAIPVELSHLFGKKNHYFELGIGASHLIIADDMKTVAFFSRVGYRYSGKKGLLVRAGVNNVFDITTNFFAPYLVLHGGVSIGYSF